MKMLFGSYFSIPVYLLCFTVAINSGCRRESSVQTDPDVNTQTLHQSTQSTTADSHSDQLSKIESKKQTSETLVIENNSTVAEDKTTNERSATLPDGIKPVNVDKSNTTYLLSAPLDLRTDMILFRLVEVMTAEQIMQAQEIVATYASEFERLASKRKSVLLNADKTTNIKQEITDLRVEIYRLRLEIYMKVFKTVLDEDQRQEFNSKLSLK